MAVGFSNWIFLCFLLFLMCEHGNGDLQENNAILLVGQSMDHHDDGNHGHAHSSSSHMNHIKASYLGFFTIDELYVGKIMPIDFPKKYPSSLPQFSHYNFPFSLKELPNLLQLFSISPDSLLAKDIEDTMKRCDFDPTKEQSKICATSLESIVSFTRVNFGLDTDHFKSLTTTQFTKSTTLKQNYTILQISKEIMPSKMVACHILPYPYAVYYCHMEKNKNKLFKVSLGGENGDRVEAVSVCHMDTSAWKPDHISFRLLGVKRGTIPICHFFSPNNLIWVPSEEVN